jgi:hypothetical protein
MRQLPVLIERRNQSAFRAHFSDFLKRVQPQCGMLLQANVLGASFHNRVAAGNANHFFARSGCGSRAYVIVNK